MSAHEMTIYEGVETVPVSDYLAAICERNSLQDQRDFCMGEIERLKQERDKARMQYETTLLLAEALAKTINEMRAERDA